MVKRVLAVLLLLSMPAAFAMDYGAVQNPPEDEKKDEDYKQAQEPLRIAINNRPIYIGTTCQDRIKVERACGKELAINTIFFVVRLFNCRKYKDLHGRVPRLLPYELIKDGQEGQEIKLNLYGKEYTAICDQMDEENSYAKQPFQYVVTLFIKQFAGRANWIIEGEESLLEYKVIDKESYNNHGVNRSPFFR